MPTSVFVPKARSSRKIGLLLSMILLAALPGMALASSYWTTLSYSEWRMGPRAGVGTGTWSDVGVGEYRFYFNKAFDGVTITSNNVHLWSD